MRRSAGSRPASLRAVATLFRCRTPTDWLCPCGRVARELRRAGEDVEEIRVPFKRADRDDVRAISGQSKVPLVVLEDGEAICDSMRIVEHLRWRTEGTVPPVRAERTDPAAPD